MPRLASTAQTNLLQGLMRFQVRKKKKKEGFYNENSDVSIIIVKTLGRKNSREEGKTIHLQISLSFLMGLWSSSTRSFIWIKKVTDKIRVKSIKW